MNLVPRLLASLALCAPLLAQGGFTPGELVLYNPFLSGSFPPEGGLVRIDPHSGQVTNLVALPDGAQNLQGSMAYDPYRDRVLFVGRIPSASDPLKLWLTDAQGNLSDLGALPTAHYDLAPASGGRIYFRTEDPAQRFGYLDASNTLHTLMDASGTQPFAPPGLQVRTMVYDPGTNALFMLVPTQSNWNCAGQNNSVAVQRVPLSDDGSRVEGSIDCTAVAVDPAGGTTGVGFTRGPNGQLVLVLDNNSNAELPRMNLIDPVSLAVTPWATNGGSGAGATNAGTWSSELQRVVILNSLANVLQIYAQGDSGMGTILQPSSQVSSAAGSGEFATLVEIPQETCDALVGLYCTAKLTSGGCTPAISTSGSPSASSGSGFVVQVGEVEPGNVGIFFYGQSGPASVSFQGGFLCVQPPTLRTPPTSSGAGGACTGSYAFDFNAYAASGVDPSLVPGSVVHGQFWFRDPPEPISGTGLSGGVTFTLCP